MIIGLTTHPTQNISMYTHHRYCSRTFTQTEQLKTRGKGIYVRRKPEDGVSLEHNLTKCSIWPVIRTNIM